MLFRIDAPPVAVEEVRDALDERGGGGVLLLAEDDPEMRLLRPRRREDLGPAGLAAAAQLRPVAVPLLRSRHGLAVGSRQALGTLSPGGIGPGMEGLDRSVRRIDRAQQRRPALAFAIAVVRKFGDDQGGHLAALVAYYAFLSLFPLLAAASTSCWWVRRSRGWPGPRAGSRDPRWLVGLLARERHRPAALVPHPDRVRLPWRAHLRGALASGTAWTALLAVGAAYVGWQVSGAGRVYGTFALVIGLLAWLLLAAQVALLGAEVNVVRAARLWPRSLVQPPFTDADRRALVRYVDESARRPEVAIEVDVRDTPNGSTERSRRG